MKSEYGYKSCRVSVERLPEESYEQCYQRALKELNKGNIDDMPWIHNYDEIFRKKPNDELNKE